jgi:hypothetical protein
VSDPPQHLYGFGDPGAPRGLRNGNPGNIDYEPSDDPWDGLDNPPTDGRFCRFTEPKYGLRVICKLLLAYQEFHGCNTIEQMINRWAPPSENDTAGYIAEVAAAVGVGDDDPIVVREPAIMIALVKAIVRQENGQQPYPDDLIAEALTMAGVQPPAPQPSA